MRAEKVHHHGRPVLMAAAAATLFLASFLGAAPAPVAAHYGCSHTDYLILHQVTGPDHYDYLDWWDHWNANSHHWNRWNNATHDFFHTDDCGCISYPCPVTVVPWIPSRSRRALASREPHRRPRLGMPQEPMPAFATD